MKTNKLWVAALAMMMAASTSVGLVSCSDDDEPAPQPEIVTNPLDAEAYYITGTVTDGTAALADVAVSTSGVSATTGADGSYKLQVKSKGAYSVEFKKDGYIAEAASAQIASDAKTQSAVSLNQQLSAANKAVTVNPDEDQEIVEAKNTGYPTIVKKSMDNGSPLPIIDMNKERDYVTVIIPINEYFNKEKLSLRDKIINALNASPMTKTELCRYLGYARVVNSVSHQLTKLIIDNKVIEINKKYHLK